MNKKSLIVLFLTGFALISFMVVGTEKPTKSEAAQLPDNVKAIIDKSCFGCHNTDSRN